LVTHQYQDVLHRGTEDFTNADFFGLRLDDEAYHSDQTKTTNENSNISKDRAVSVLSCLGANWKAKEVMMPTYEIPAQADAANLYFVDFPDAK